MHIFVLFLWICSGGSAIVLLTTSTTNIDGEIFSYLVQFKVIQLTFWRLEIVRTGEEKKIHGKVANCFYLKVPKSLNLTNQCGGEFETVASSLCKIKIQQDQKKITKINKNQIKPRQKK